MIYWHLCAGHECPPEGKEIPDFLSPSERRTYDQLRFPKRRSEWLLGRWTAKQLLRRSLDGYEALALSAISVGADPDGAPYLSVQGEGRLPASLSISHRAGRAVCALSPALSPAVGIDLERVEPRSRAFVEDFFTAQEAARVWACPAGQRDTLVTAIWSAKEAVLKAFRQGLRVDTRAVEVRHVAGLDMEGAGAPEELPPAPGLHRVDTALAPPPAGAPGSRRSPQGGSLAFHSSPSTSLDWQPVQVASTVPGALRIAAWWQPEGDAVLTMAAVWP